ncbi:alkaline shock response membrane anchor protein AmaP [Acidaminococcus fermentans DSM 20731]|uniref:Alkaline shock response membrane anchor protein AmaP n=1 Tax=Acidaminococcus fermentans (strain ATCC 25085 / DSM 20731 / CCUG 9996 / CIP 106432 / VR4) TaxID=591001 RepID=D2RJI0_ACIFV|nr:alkaline shock response membrane anchor protein AmaP [Acidaminococcus fermentans]ADB47232.1 conserved hypothetical protein [Acidaminococcus fermentans DSM 20731]UEA72165.1 alkaline shock response membrane anchor protein AmaP [Acidaminococcus fermentans DSM 20731]
MSIFDRIILTLYTIIMAAVAVLIVIVSVNGIPVHELTEFAVRVPGRWEYTIGGVIIFLVSLRLLFASWSRGGSNDLTFDNERDGKIHVSQRAMEDYIAGFTNDVYGVYGAKCRVKLLKDSQLGVRINASVEPGINIPDTTDEVKRTVKKNIMNVIGVEVADVAVYFKHIKAKE